MGQKLQTISSPKPSSKCSNYTCGSPIGLSILRDIDISRSIESPIGLHMWVHIIHRFSNLYSLFLKLNSKFQVRTYAVICLVCLEISIAVPGFNCKNVASIVS